MVCDEVEGLYSPIPHIAANIIQQFSCNTLPAVFLLHIQRTQVGRQIRSVVKIIGNYAAAGNYPVPIYDIVPLRNCVVAAQAIVHAFKICFDGNIEFAVKPFGRPLLHFGAVNDPDDPVHPFLLFTLQ